jgi:hypothetical protein
MSLFPLLAILCCLLSGCQALGIFANAAGDLPVDPKYKGLGKQHVAVMVWTDRATATDWPRLQLDLSRGIESRLDDIAKGKDHPKYLDGTTLAAAESVVRYQRDHPEIESQSITDVAPKLAVTRLIYIEVLGFATRPEDSVELLRGTVSANLKVLDVKSDFAKVVYEEENIKVAYPAKAPEEGLPNLSEIEIYEKTLDAFSIEILNRFIPHVEENK